MKALRTPVIYLGSFAVTALGVTVLVQAHRHPEQALGGGGAAAAVLQVAAGVGVWLAGLDLALRGRPRGAPGLLAATGPALLLGAVPLPEAGGALVFTAALVGGTSAPALAGAAGLLHPAATSRIDVALACAAIAGATVALGVLATATFDPAATGCFACPDNLLLARGDAGFHDALVRNVLWAEACLCAGVAALALVRWVRRPALARWAAAPVAAGGAIAAALGAASYAHAAHLGAPQVDDTARALWLSMSAVLLVTAA